MKAGSQTITESSTVSVLRGPDRGGHTMLEIFDHGVTPLYQSSISIGVLEADTAPFDLRLTVSAPPIPTLVFEPDASISSLSLTLGVPGGLSRAGAVVVPRRCPAGGLALAASFTFADRSSAAAAARIPCG